MLSKRTLVGIRWSFQTLAMLFFMLVGVSAYAADPAVANTDEAIAAGKTVFNANCKTCHKLDQKYIGPALRGATDRNSAAWVKTWIKNSQAVIASGDAYAVALYKEYNNSIMPSYAFLSDTELDGVLAYIEYGDKVDPAAAAAPGAAACDPAATAAGSGIPNEYLSIIVGVLVFILLLILIVLGLIVTVLTKYINKQDLP